MSYILDALKKNQAEQAGDVMSLSVAHTQDKNKTPGWVYIVVAALVINGGLLAWFIAAPSDSEEHIAAENVVAEKVAEKGGTQPEETMQPTEVVQAAESAKPTPQEPAAVATTEAPQPVIQRPSARPPQPIQRPAIAEVMYESLTPSEQVAYDSFSYTSHIYTDAKDLRAIVIDGQRVQIGDSFKGLKVYDITETGVVFEENRRGSVRRVRVSPFE